MARNPLRGFLLRVVLLLPAAFLAWHALAGPLVAPALWGAGELLTLWLPDLVAGVRQDGATMLLASRYGELEGVIVPAAEAEFQLGFRVDTRLLSYAIPFYAALHFATPMPGVLERFARGLILLWLAILVGLVCMALKDLMVTLGDLLFAVGGVPPESVIGVAYQFCVLIVPPVAPLLLWAWEARELPWLREILGRPPAGASAPAAPPTGRDRDAG